MRLKELLQKFRPKPKPLSGQGERSVDNVDAWAAAAGTRTDPTAGVQATFPPNYVPPADEGRPPH